ncbi:hypothetical protein SADUNF_Sadunf03G0044000 [Salix dunnii]|uniref:Uncharacterized protein n=1 Tax=Salix dunnii TaxID=1413687 RepID=A0A835K8Z0_9ROSI|nr:hypothetical protein SADUNF_Sadunf03G0044000 [Salix dunnii]
MGFLHKLWDETLAGPMPDSGLGKLRKYDSFSVRSSPPVHAAAANSNEEMNITRSIAIVMTNSSKYLRNISVDPSSAPESPSTPSTPTTPLTRKLTSYVSGLSTVVLSIVVLSNSVAEMSLRKENNIGTFRIMINALDR